MWLAIVRQRCLARVLATGPAPMTPAERAKLLDAALRSNGPDAFLAGMASAFDGAGRDADAALATSLQLLYRDGEIETLMFTRATWLGKLGSRQPRPI